MTTPGRPYWIKASELIIRMVSTVFRVLRVCCAQSTERDGIMAQSEWAQSIASQLSPAIRLIESCFGSHLLGVVNHLTQKHHFVACQRLTFVRRILLFFHCLEFSFPPHTNFGITFWFEDSFFFHAFFSIDICEATPWAMMLLNRNEHSISCIHKISRTLPLYTKRWNFAACSRVVCVHHVWPTLCLRRAHFSANIFASVRCDGMRSRPYSWKNQLRLSAANGGKCNQIPFGWVSIRSFYFVLIFPHACTSYSYTLCAPLSLPSTWLCCSAWCVLFTFEKCYLNQWKFDVGKRIGRCDNRATTNFSNLGPIGHSNFILVQSVTAFLPSLQSRWDTSSESSLFKNHVHCQYVCW